MVHNYTYSQLLLYIVGNFGVHYVIIIGQYNNTNYGGREWWGGGGGGGERERETECCTYIYSTTDNYALKVKQCIIN